MKTAAWWAVALSESVTNAKPFAAVCDGEELVLFRDTAGPVRALKDRCPHRRVPLSLGCVKGGSLQCGYHGWTFDGGTGQCTAIPNLRGEEQVPAHYAAQAHRVAEANGFVHVCLGSGVPPDALPAATYLPEGHEFTGTAIANIAHTEYLAVVLDGPQCLLNFGMSKEEFMADKRTQSAVVMRLVIIGEAATKVMDPHPEFAEQTPQTPWRSMRGMRNRIAHGHFDINLDVV